MNGACVGNNVLEMRQGMVDEDLTGTGFTGPVLWMGRFVTNRGVEETWAAANNGGVAALARKVNNVWSPVAFSDVPNAANLLYMQGVGMNGKFFLAYDSNVNRLHVWDGTSVRRVGLGAGDARRRCRRAAARARRSRARIGSATSCRSSGVDRCGARSRRRGGRRVTDKLVDHRQPRRAARMRARRTGKWKPASAPAGPWYRIATVPIATLDLRRQQRRRFRRRPQRRTGQLSTRRRRRSISATDGLS